MEMAKQKHVLVVFSNPTTEGQESEYNDWYTNQHLGEVLDVPGVVAAQRFKLHGDSTTLPGRYLALYEVEHNDPPAVMQGLTNASASGVMYLSPAIDVANTITSFYTPITGRVAKKTKPKSKPKSKAKKKAVKKVAKKKTAKKSVKMKAKRR
jgi:hypothetical protein